MTGKRRAIVYIDGFNVYYGCLQGTPYRWLDLGALCRFLLPSEDIVAIRYFTARVGPRPWEPKKPQGQQIYLRALATVPGLTIHFGHFITSQTNARLIKEPHGGTPWRQVWKTEEKGSDVNLASYLLVDGFRARYDIAAVMSNDGDLKEPVRFVREDLKAPVAILNPHKNRSYALSPHTLPSGSFYKHIGSGALAASQFPPTVTDAKGTITKPKGW